MKLTAQQLSYGFAAAATVLNPDYDHNTFGSQAEQRQKMSDWLSPCLLLLPDVKELPKLSEAILNNGFEEEFLEAAAQFKLNVMRNDQQYDNYSDVDLLKRVTDEDLVESANHLGYLCSVVLDAAFTVNESEEIVFTRLDSPSVNELLNKFSELPLEELLKEK